MRDTQLSMDRFQPASAHPSPDEVPPGYKRTEVGLIPCAWGVYRVESLCDVIDGDRGTHYPGASEFSDKGYCLFLNAGNVTKDGFRFNECTFITHEKDALLNKGKLRRFDIVLTTRGTVGNLAYYDISILFEHIRINSGMVILRCESPSLDTCFLYASLQSHVARSQIERLSFGSAQPQLTVKGINGIHIVIPSLPEQRAIATALSDADGLIRALDELIEKKRAIKQATMQQLLTGKKRLPGFEDADAYKQIEGVTTPVDWSVTKLSQVCKEVLNGGTPSTKISEYWEGTIPWITGADVVGQKIEEVHKFITEEAVENSATNVVPKGNLLLVTRTGVGKVAIAPFDIAISQDLTGFILTKNTNVEYLYWIFNRASKHLLNMSQGTSIGGIKKDDLMNFTLFLPPLPEQRAIATILSVMDAEIAALKRRREKTQQIKQGMMQELLTGRTHLIDPPEEAPA